MERHGLDHENALQHLMQQARERDTTLLQVSAELTAGTPADRN